MIIWWDFRNISNDTDVADSFQNVIFHVAQLVFVSKKSISFQSSLKIKLLQEIFKRF